MGSLTTKVKIFCKKIYNEQPQKWNDSLFVSKRKVEGFLSIIKYLYRSNLVAEIRHFVNMYQIFDIDVF